MPRRSAELHEHERVGEELIRAVLGKVAEAATEVTVRAAQSAQARGGDIGSDIAAALDVLREAIRSGTDELVDQAIRTSWELLDGGQPGAAAAGGRDRPPPAG